MAIVGLGGTARVSLGLASGLKPPSQHCLCCFGTCCAASSVEISRRQALKSLRRKGSKVEKASIEGRPTAGTIVVSLAKQCGCAPCQGIDMRLNLSYLALANGSSRPTSTHGKCSGATKAPASSCRPLLLLLNLLPLLLVAANAIPTAAAAIASPQNTSRHGHDASTNAGRYKHRPSPLRRKRKQTGGQRQVREVDRKSSRSNHFRQHTTNSKDDTQTDDEAVVNYAQAQTEAEDKVQMAKLHFYSQQKEPIPMHNNDDYRQYNYAKYTDDVNVIGNAIVDEKHTNQERPDKIARLQFYLNYPQSEPKPQPKPKQGSGGQVAHLTFYQLEGGKEKKEEGLLAWLAKQQVQNYQAVPITSESVSNEVLMAVPTPTPTPTFGPTSHPTLSAASESPSSSHYATLEIVGSTPSASPSHRSSTTPTLAPPSSSVPTAAPTATTTLESWTSYYYASLSYSYEYYSYSYSYSMSMDYDTSTGGAARDDDDGAAFRNGNVDNRYGNRYGHDDTPAKTGRGSSSSSYARRDRRQQRQKRRRIRNMRRKSKQ